MSSIYKGTHKRFRDDDYSEIDYCVDGSANKNSNIGVIEKYWVSTTDVGCLGKGTIASRMRERYMRAKSPLFVSPILAIPRNRSKYEVHQELATCAIQIITNMVISLFLEQTEFQVLDLLAVIQKLLHKVILSNITFTAKDIKATDKYALKKFTTRVVINHHTGVREFGCCYLQESLY